jgi:CelD/BcsL family acetyltransferase involved in cellulose biosynthesis
VIELRSHDGVPGGTFRHEWRGLVDEDPLAGIFHTPRYLDLWWRELGKGVRARVHGAYVDGRLVGVIPVARELEGSPTGPIEVVRFLGGTEVTDYLGPISRPEYRNDIVAAYVRKLVEDADWDEFVAGGVPEESGWADAFATHAEDAGLEVLEVEDEEVCPRVSLAGGYDGFLERLGGKQRHELKRKARKLQRDAGDVRIVEVPPEEHEGALEAFFRMAADIGDEKSRFFVNEEMRAYFTALADEFGGDRTLRLHVLEVGGMPGAATVSLVEGREWGLYNSAFDETLRMLAPGMVLVGELIREAAEEGCEVFDLLRGDEAYKYRFGAEDRVLKRVSIVRNSR